MCECVRVEAVCLSRCLALRGESVSEESFAKIYLVPGTQNAGLEISVRLVRETLNGKKSQRLSSCI